jgi:hypothetical protein
MYEAHVGHTLIPDLYLWQLLSDVLALRAMILDNIDARTHEALSHRGEVYIAVVAAGGYEVRAICMKCM